MRFAAVLIITLAPRWSLAFGQTQTTETYVTSSLPVNSTHSEKIPVGNILAITAAEGGANASQPRPQQQPNASPLNHHHQQQQQKKQKRGRKITQNSENELIQRIRLIPKDKLHGYKLGAARRLQINLVRKISVTVDKVPVAVQTAAKNAIVATQAGKLTQPIVNNLGLIIEKGTEQQENPAEQLQMILGEVLPHLPPPLKDTMHNINVFVAGNVATVNNMLGDVLGGTPNLLAGVINSLTNSLGTLSTALTGTLASVGTLLGGLLG